jgi:hypothetical protein
LTEEVSKSELLKEILKLLPLTEVIDKLDEMTESGNQKAIETRLKFSIGAVNIDSVQEETNEEIINRLKGLVTFTDGE